ncbi:MAG: lipid A deacylase LpxR family protein [Myxococcota bacterium]
MPRRLGLALVATAFAVGALARAPAAAESPARPFTLGARLDNDVFGDSDRYFTNLFALTFDARLATLPLRRWGPSALSLDVAVVQSIYTPRFLRLPAPTWGDRPYAGWLRGRLGALLQGQRDALGLYLSAGVVGPGALGRQTQRAVHTVLGIYQPEGWDTQLPNRLSVQVALERAHLRGGAFGDGGRAGAGVWGATDLGTIRQEAAAGAGTFVSWRLPDLESVAVFSPRLAAPAYGSPDRVGLAFAGAYVQRLVLFDHLLETRPPAVNHDVEGAPVLHELRLVAILRYRRLRIRYAQIVQSRVFERQRRAHIWGIAEVSLSF